MRGNERFATQTPLDGANQNHGGQTPAQRAKDMRVPLGRDRIPLPIRQGTGSPRVCPPCWRASPGDTLIGASAGGQALASHRRGSNV